MRPETASRRQSAGRAYASRTARKSNSGRYELFRRDAALDTAVWDKLVRGLSTRKYEAVVREFAEAYGIEKSAVSEHFIEASRAKLKQLRERPLGDLRRCAMLADATPFKGHHLAVARGVTVDGRQLVLGWHEGATENATVAGTLLSDLIGRGLDLTAPLRWVLDGAKALHAAVGKQAGAAAAVQRCPVHKRRNVCGHLPNEQQTSVRRKLNAAYALTGYADAKRALDYLHRELRELPPSAARSRAEGLEETLTGHRLGVPRQLRLTLARTNVIESACSVVETVCRNVKRGRAGDQAERWVGSGLVVAEAKFRRVKRDQQIPLLVSALKSAADKKVVAQPASRKYGKQVEGRALSTENRTFPVVPVPVASPHTSGVCRTR